MLSETSHLQKDKNCQNCALENGYYGSFYVCVRITNLQKGIHERQKRMCLIWKRKNCLITKNVKYLCVFITYFLLESVSPNSCVPLCKHCKVMTLYRIGWMNEWVKEILHILISVNQSGIHKTENLSENLEDIATYVPTGLAIIKGEFSLATKREEEKKWSIFWKYIYFTHCPTLRQNIWHLQLEQRISLVPLAWFMVPEGSVHG